jgi:RNA polymerase sigma-70 factor (ECF subfamily)
MTDLEALYRQHAPAVFRFALSLSGSRAAADDLTSETFLRLWAARDRVELSTVLGYLLTITRHLHLQGVARDRRRDPLEGDPADSRPSPGSAAESRSELQAVLADLQTLPEVDRSALLMRANHALPYEEIGAALSISAGAARVRVHRARQRLAALRLNRFHHTNGDHR